MRDIDISILYSNPPTDQPMHFMPAGRALRYRPDRRLWLYGAHRRGSRDDALGLPSDAHILMPLRHSQAGALLAAAGFTHIDGADLSPEMRDVAARLGVYKNLYHLDMTADYALQIADVENVAHAR